ncbi:MAG TPA: penicillin-binding protein 2 [candidate division Zixibacteria bacterium]|nr:penicillin-binding protein 2 [candidate division Zixibacteria bacterium]
MTHPHLPLELRAKAALALVIAGALFLVAGLVRLQIFKYAQMAAQSEANRLRIVPIVPRRGVVYDRDGRRIIDNRPSYTLSVVPAEEVRGVTVPNLARLLGVDTLEIRKRIRRNTISVFQPAPVQRDVSFETIAVIEEQVEQFPGVGYQVEQVRQYPVGLGAEVFTGYVGEVSREELERYGNDNYPLGSMIGKKGIEKQYDQLLRGREGTRYMEVSATGQLLGEYRGRQRQEATPGTDLTLTIDLDLQRACGEALDTLRCGAIVAADPRTGEILAMASYPAFDANVFSGVIPESLWTAISSDTLHPLLNRPLAGLYPPGSTAKVVTVGAGLEEGLITPSSTFRSCIGGYQFGNRFFRCWEKGGHGSLVAAHAIEQSCDVYMYQAGLKLGVDRLSEYYIKCGFGRPTGINLPGELKGFIPTTEWYNRTYGKSGWTRAGVLNNSIGQGEVLATPLHLLQLYCGLAGNGIVQQLHIVRRFTTPAGDELEVSPKIKFALPFSESTLAILREGIELVVQGDRGTARSLRRKEYRIGGKTGTAQNPHGNDHAWFCGVAPLEAPEIVVVAIVENAGHGSTAAAPVVGKIIDAYMKKKRDPEAFFAEQQARADSLAAARALAGLSDTAAAPARAARGN